MIYTIIETVTAIEFRRLNRWENVQLPSPSTQQMNNTLDMVSALLNPDLAPIDSDANKWLLENMERLIKCQQELSHNVWQCQPHGIPQAQMDWYLCDLLFYCGLSHNIIQGCRLLALDEWEEKLPPLSSFVPQIEDSGLLELLSYHFNHTYQWLGLLKEELVLIPIKREMVCLHHLAEERIGQHPLVKLIYWVTEARTDLLFRSLADERRLTKQISQLSSFLSNKIAYLPFCEKGRALVKYLLELELQDDVFSLEVVSVYQQSVIQQVGTEQWQQELDYWKVSNSSVGRLNHCFVMMLQRVDQLVNSTQVEDSMADKLRWHGSGEELAKVFVGLSKKGLIRYKGNGYITPLAMRLFRVFMIEKVRGDGFLTESSFLSYFKKFNSEVA